MSRPPLVLYHNDADGFCAAWVASKHLPSDTEFRAVQYGDDPPLPADIKGREVFVLDFSFSEAINRAIAGSADHLVVIDHHKTSREAVQAVGGVWDDRRSGAMLAWHFWHTGGAMASDDLRAPLLVQYVQDRDLWRWALEDSEAVNAYITAVPFDFPSWHMLAADLDERFRRIVAGGRAILEARDRLVERMTERAEVVKFPLWSPKFSHDFPKSAKVPCVNATVLQSEVGQALSPGHPFSVSWMHVGGKFVVSLRSAPDGMDVAEIAKGHGGGGHKHAAGFECERLPWNTLKTANLADE